MSNVHGDDLDDNLAIDDDIFANQNAAAFEESYEEAAEEQKNLKSKKRKSKEIDNENQKNDNSLNEKIQNPNKKQKLLQLKDKKKQISKTEDKIIEKSSINEQVEFLWSAFKNFFKSTLSDLELQSELMGNLFSKIYFF